MAKLVFTVTSDTMRDVNNSSSVLTINGVVADVGSVINAGDVVQIVAQGNQTFFWSDSDNRTSVFLTITGGSGDHSQYFYMSDDYRTGTLVAEEVASGDTVHWMTILGATDYTPQVGAYRITQEDYILIRRCNITATAGSSSKPLITGRPINNGDVVQYDLPSSFSDTAVFAARDGNSKPAIYIAYLKDGAEVDVEGSMDFSKQTATMKVDTSQGVMKGIFYSVFDNSKSIDGVAYVLSPADATELKSSGVTLTQGNLTLKAFSRVFESAEVVATADKGRTFYDDSTTDAGVSIYFAYGKFGDDGFYPFDITDNTKATLTIAPREQDLGPITRLESATKQETPSIVGSNKIYRITNDDLAKVETQRWTLNNQTDTVYDYGEYIINLLRLPFKVPSDYVLASEPIELANKSLTVNAPVISVDSLPLDLGSITVKGEYSDLRDYSGVTATLHLPRCDSVNLDLQYVIDKTVSVKYFIDLYTGRATVNIYSEGIDGAIVSKEVDIGVTVPFRNPSSNTIDNNGVEVSGDNGVLAPYIEIVKIPVVLADGQFTNPIVDEAILKGQTGFIQVEDIDLITSALQSEQAEIVSKLSQGIIIRV